MVAFSPYLAAVRSGAGLSGSRRSLDGVALVLNGLEPGVSARFTFGEGPASSPIAAINHTLSMEEGLQSLSAYCRWALGNQTLYPGRVYEASLAAGRVQVVSVG